MVTVPADSTVERMEGLLGQRPEDRGTILRRLRRSPSGIVGALLVGLTVIAGVGSVAWTPYSAVGVSPNESFAPPSFAHLLGTDEYGRDELSRLLVGAQLTLVEATLGVLIAAAIGIPAGLLAAEFGGKTEEALMRATDIVYAFPAVLLATILAGARGGGSTLVATVAVGIALSPVYARVTRSGAVEVLGSGYVRAARAYGRGHLAILRRHVVRNVAWLIVVQTAVLMSVAILATSAMSYLGLGTAPPTPSWGGMLESAQVYLSNDPKLAIWPAAAIVGLVLGLNLFAEFLQETLARGTGGRT